MKVLHINGHRGPPNIGSGQEQFLTAIGYKKGRKKVELSSRDDLHIRMALSIASKELEDSIKF